MNVKVRESKGHQIRISLCQDWNGHFPIFFFSWITNMLMFSPANLLSSASQSAKPQKVSPRNSPRRCSNLHSCIGKAMVNWYLQIGYVLASNLYVFGVGVDFQMSRKAEENGLLYSITFGCIQLVRKIWCFFKILTILESLIQQIHVSIKFQYSLILVNMSLRFWWFLLLKALEILHLILNYVSVKTWKWFSFLFEQKHFPQNLEILIFYGTYIQHFLKPLFSGVFVFAKTSLKPRRFEETWDCYVTQTQDRATYMSKIASYPVGTCRIMMLNRCWVSCMVWAPAMYQSIHVAYIFDLMIFNRCLLKHIFFSKQLDSKWLGHTNFIYSSWLLSALDLTAWTNKHGCFQTLTLCDRLTLASTSKRFAAVVLAPLEH